MTTIQPSDSLTCLLKSVYPTVNWNKVVFHGYLPWFIPKFRASAVTLPGYFDRDLIHVYFKKFNPSDVAGLSLIIHEGFHVLQFTDSNVRGFGFMRNFMFYYLGAWVTYGFTYKNHPLEIPAFKKEDCFNSKLTSYLKKNQVEVTEFLMNVSHFINENPDLITHTSSFEFKGRHLAYLVGCVLVFPSFILLSSIYLCKRILHL